MATFCQPWQKSREFGATHINRDTCHELKRGPTGRRSSSARHLGCVFRDMKPPKCLFYGRAQTCRNQSNVWHSRKLLHVTLKFETKILRSDIYAQVHLISAAPTLQNLRIGLKRRQSGKSKVPAKQRGSWPKFIKIKGAWKSNTLLTFGKWVLACIKS